LTLSGAAIGVIRQALLDWKVLFFQNQDITTEQHLAFGRRFGELEVHPFAPEQPGFPEVLAITHDEDSVGGDTLFAEFDAT
jgi:taurine dioxygenase